MSADNWRTCPNCKRILENERKTIYGRVPEDEYLPNIKRIEEAMIKQTFSEYIDIGIYGDDEFYINYKGSCHKCGFEHKFTHRENITLYQGNK